MKDFSFLIFPSAIEKGTFIFHISFAYHADEKKSKVLFLLKENFQRLRALEEEIVRIRQGENKKSKNFANFIP